MWGSGKDEISGRVEGLYHSYRHLLSRPPEEAIWIDWLITPDTQSERRCDVMMMMVVVVVSMVHLFYVFLPEHWFYAILRIVICLDIKSVMQVRAMGKLSLLASRAWVSGQERWHATTCTKMLFILESHIVYGEIFPCRLLLWDSFTTAGSNRSLTLVLLVWC